MTYKSFEDIKFEVIEDLKKDPDKVFNIKMICKENLIGLHHNVGQWIRNKYKLWAPDNPLVDKIIHNLINSIFESFHITDDMNMFPLSFATHKSRSVYELNPILYLIADEDCYYYNEELKEWNRSSIKKEKLVPSLIKLNVKDFT